MAVTLKGHSAYHGGSWRPRTSSHQEECGSVWPLTGADSEFGFLEEVLLYRPPKNPPRLGRPEKLQHLRPIDWLQLRREMARLAAVLEKAGVQVHRLNADDFADFKPNLMFTRDLFFMTPWGAVLGRMASPVRAGEEKWAQLALSRLGIPIICMIRGHGTFEGADALWLSPNLVLVGVGNRTNAEGFLQLRKLLADFGVRAIKVQLPKSVQHLLGLLQIVSENTALLRRELCDPALGRALNRSGYRIVEVPEWSEVVHRQAMNVLTLKPGLVLMPSGCPKFKDLLMRNGISVQAEVPISQLLNAAGGIACAVHPLKRTLHKPSKFR